MSSPPETDHPAPDVAGPIPFSTRERWTFAGTSLWLVTGLQLDAYAHANFPDLETFWTPWHAVLYSGIAACGLALLWLLRPRLPRSVSLLSYRDVLRATPSALRLPVVGMALLLVGGGIDTLWHNLFGIEQGLEIFFGPSHFFIIVGMVLVACGPALMVADSPARSLTGGNAVVVILSGLLAALPVNIFTWHASALVEPLLGTGDSPMDTFSLDAQMMHAYVGSTVVLLLPVLVIGRRWPLPRGGPLVLVATPALLMGLVLGDVATAWLPLTVVAAVAAVEVAARLALPALRGVDADTRWMLLGLIAPVVVWGAVLAVGAARAGVGWPLHMVSGLLVCVALLGFGTAFVARRVQPRPVPAP